MNKENLTSDCRKYMALIILISSLFFISNVFACPPSTSEYLYVKQVYITSDEFNFLTTNLEQANHSYRNKVHLGTYPYFNFSGNPDYLKISVNDEELFNLEVSSLKTDVRRFNHDIQEWRDIPVHRFPNSEMDGHLRDLNNNLSYFDNSNIKIFLDTHIVREFSIGYEPAHIFKCNGLYSKSLLDYLIPLVIFLGIISVIIVVILKKVKK